MERHDHNPLVIGFKHQFQTMLGAVGFQQRAGDGFSGKQFDGKPDIIGNEPVVVCLLYTSDAADE